MVTRVDFAVEVVHHVPGRIRLRVPALHYRPKLAERILTVGMAQPGVRRVRVNLDNASVVIEGELSERPEAALGRWLATPPRTPVPTSPRAANPPEVSRARLLPLGVSLAGIALSFVPGIGQSLALGMTLLGALPIVRRGLGALIRERRLTVDHLDSTAVGIMATLGDVRGAGLMCALVALGEEIRERTARRSQRAALDLQTALGQSAWVVRGPQKVRVPVASLSVGDVVVAYPGDLIPVDGLVLDGTAAVDQKMLTGESRPMAKSSGERVLAGTSVVDGRLYVRAEAVGSMTRAGWVARLLEEAPDLDSRAARHADQFANRLVAPTFVLAGASLALTGSPARAAAILIVDFATGIRVSAPTSVMATLGRAARDGVLIKSGRAIEKLATVDAMIFDKTGTLTHGKLDVSDVISLDARLSPDELLAFAAAAELRLHHPMAQAIVKHAEQRGLEIPQRDTFQYSVGLGVVASVEDCEVWVGNARFMNASGLLVDRLNGAVSQLRAQGASLVYVAINRKLAGLLAYRDPVRSESVSVVNQLRARGVRDILMVTGDELKTGRAVAGELGIDDVRAGVLPDEKAAIVHELQRQGRVVAVIGDGINDSPALAHADVSISLSHGAEIARETADVLLMDSDLNGLVRAVDLSRICVGLIRQNLYVVGVPNAAALALATAGSLTPVGSTILNNGSTVVAALNSLRPLVWLEGTNGHASPPLPPGAVNGGASHAPIPLPIKER